MGAVLPGYGQLNFGIETDTCAGLRVLPDDGAGNWAIDEGPAMKARLFASVAALSLALGPAVTSAQTAPTTLTLAQAQSIALENHPNVKIASRVRRNPTIRMMPNRSRRNGDRNQPQNLSTYRRQLHDVFRGA